MEVLLWLGAIAASFVFIFSLVTAIREAVQGGDRDLKYTLLASISLLWMFVCHVLW